jgi:DNA helicase HerA-like ATPase
MNTSLPIHFIKTDEKEHYNINKLAPKWPFILIIIGRSGSGKTNTVVNLLKYLFFDTFYLYAKDLDEPYYQLLQNVFDDEKIRPKEPHEDPQSVSERDYGSADRRPIIESYFSSDIEDIVDVDELDRYKQNLIVVDDFVTEKDQKKLIDLAIRGRKMNASMIYITQDWYRVPKSIRLQCNYLSIFPSCDGNDISLIFREKGLDKKLRKYYENNIKNFDCLTIDFKTPEMKYRKNFTPINDWQSVPERDYGSAGRSEVKDDDF